MRSIMLSLAFILLGCASFAALPADRALDKPLTLSLKGQALADIAAVMEQKTGAHLTVDRAIADQKATIFVDDKPQREVMDGIAMLFGYQWSAKDVDGKKAYRLFQDPAERKAAEQRRAKLKQQAKEEVLSEIKMMNDYSSKSEEDLQEIKDRLEPLFGDSGPTTLTDQAAKEMMKSAKEYGAVMMVTEDPMAAAGARVYSKLPQKVRDALWSGMDVYVDSESPEEQWLVSQEDAQAIIRGVAKRDTEFDGPDPEDGKTSAPKPRIAAQDISIKFYVEEKSDSLDVSMALGFRQKQGAAFQEGSFISGSTGTVASTSLKYMDQDPKEGPKLPVKDRKSLGQKKISITSKEWAAEANIPGQSESTRPLLVTRSDVLAQLHAKAGLQVISDYYSEWSSVQPAKDVPVERYIAQHVEGHGDECAVGWDGKFLFCRMTMPTVLDEAEVPNRLLRPWQKQIAKRGSFSLDQLADICQLSKAQLEMLNENANRLRLGAINQGAFTDTALGVYGSLSRKQRTEAFAGGTPVGAFAAAQHATLAQYLREERMFPSDFEVRVGVYSEDGVRVDKPAESAQHVSDQPVAVAMKQAGTDDTTLSDFSTYTYTSEEEMNAMSESAHRNPEYVRNVLYFLTVKYSDGKSSAHWVRVPQSKLPPGTEPKSYESPENAGRETINVQGMTREQIEELMKQMGDENKARPTPAK